MQYKFVGLLNINSLLKSFYFEDIIRCDSTYPGDAFQLWRHLGSTTNLKR